MEETSKVQASKKMKYAKLRDELNKLENNIQTLDSNIKVTVEQVPSFRKMGTLHASILMSVKSVLNEPQQNHPSNS